MDVLSRKLLRDLGDIRGQAITIALVVAAGVASFISLRSTFASVIDSRDEYYSQYRFGSAFAQLKRAPESVAARIEAIRGVTAVHTRVTGSARIHRPPPATVATGLIVSIPGHEAPRLNGYHLVAGRRPRPGRGDEALLLDTFANRSGISPGESIDVTFNGRRRSIEIVGIASSPEFIYPMPPGAGVIPDDERFGVLWMDREGISPALDMEGAFNDLVIQIQPQASEARILAEIDKTLEAYGSAGAYGRDLQPSNLVLDGELEQLRSFATVLPFVFLGVAAFLLNVVLFRLIQLHRAQIATLKAVGYDDRRIGIHYLKLAGTVVFVGIAVGTGLGAYLGEALTELYAKYFHIPVLAYRLQPYVFFYAAGISLVAAVTGALRGVLNIVRMPPAEAMRPPAPASYKTTFLERLRLHRVFGESARMIIREISRSPLRAVISAVAIAFAMAITITGRFGYDLIEEFVELQFETVMREDMTLVFSQSEGLSATRELARLPGVIRAEGLRVVPARLRQGAQWRDVGLYGYPEGGQLRQLVDKEGEVHRIPSEGVVLTALLGEILDLDVGDRVRAEIREGRRPTLELTVVGLVEDPVGLNGHMSLSHLSDLLREAPRASAGIIRIGPGTASEIRRRADEMPGVIDVSATDDLVARFHEQTGGYFWAMTLILSMFASAIAVGVIYNNARVMLSMRQRDLASLRVLGFTKREIAAIMSGELSLQVLLAIPVGFFLGKWGAVAVMSTVEPERFRFPVVVGLDTYVFAVAVVLLSALVAGLLVRRRVYHMDLIGVLKTRE